MCDHAYEMGGIANRSDDPRITKVGAFLRRTSLDEIPQMLNIVNGTMCIIGPRPILDWEFEPYKDKEDYIRRYEAMPGTFMAMAAGKPILCNAGMGYSPIRKYHIGTDKYLATPKEYAEAILTYYKLDKVEYETLCNNCKRTAEDFDCYKLIKNMETYCGL